MTIKMNRIVPHHSAGGYNASQVDRQHYHRIVDGEGRRHAGIHPISANAPGKPLRSGYYAAHTRGLNTGSIGVAMSCMLGASWSDPRSCAHFPKPEQVSGLIKELADLCVDYSIPVTRNTLLTHAEVEITLNIEQAGKWDLDYDPWGRVDSRDPIVIGDMIRDAVSVEIRAIGGRTIPTVASPRRLLRRGYVGEDVKELQILLNKVLGLDKPLVADGAFGPATRNAVVLFQIESQLLPDGVVGKMTWTAILEGAKS